MNEELKVIISAEISDLQSNVSQATDTVNEFAQETETANSESNSAFSGISAAAAAQFAIVENAVGQAIGKIQDFISDAVSYGDTVDKQSQKMQMSAKSYQEWSYVLQRNGSDISALQKGIKGITADLGDMASGVEVDTTAYDALGVSLQNADGSMRSTEDVMTDCILALADMDDITQRNALAQDLFGNSYAELLPLLNSGSESINELIAVADEYAVVTDEDIKASADLADAQLTMQTALQQAGSAIAGVLMPALTAVAGVLADVFNWLGQHKTLAAVLVTIIGALAAAFVAYHTVMTTVKVVTAAVNAVQAIFNAILLANPITLVIIAIVALIAAIVLLITHWDEVKEKVIEVWNNMKEKITAAVEAIKATIENMKAAVREKFEAIKSAITEKVNAAKETVSNVFENIKSSITNKVNAAKQTITNVFTAIKTAITTPLNSAKETITSIFTNIHNTIQTKINNAKSVVQNAINAIKGFFNFSWSLPHLKLPHISISGSFSLTPPSVPHFGISWYAKGGVFDQPTLFPYGGKIGGLGENGAEAVVPLENNTEWLSRIADMLVDRMGVGSPIVLKVNDKVFAETAIESINNLTKQTHSLGLVLA